MAFTRGCQPIWILRDLTGLPLNDQYFISYLTNTLPYIPQFVFQDPAGTVPWSDPIQFLPNGELPDNIFGNPNLVYRLEVRQGPLQSDPLIYEVNNYVFPEGPETIITSENILTANNQIENPQFALVNFTATPGSSGQPQLTISQAGTYQIAPGWMLVLTGAGTATLTQLILSGAADPVSVGNPPYALRIAVTGFTTADLVQRFQGNGAIFNGGAIGMSMLAVANGSPLLVSELYKPSDSGNPLTIFQGTIAIGTFQTYGAFINITPPSTDTDLSTVAYVDMDIQLPVPCDISISNVQVMGQSTPASAALLMTIPAFQETTQQTQVSNLFYYYANELLIKPKKSILTGWNFALNPWQFYNPATSTVLAAQTAYTADQTIIHQESASAVIVNQNDYANRTNLLVTAYNGNTVNRFAVIQYIDPATIRPYWSYIVSSLARILLFSPLGTSIRMKMRLIWRTTLPSSIGNAEPITGWDSNGDLVFSSGWTAIKPLNDPAYILSTSPLSGEGPNAYPYYEFNGLVLPDASTSTMTLGIVLYTMDAMNQTLGQEDAIAFDKVSLVPNAFAVDTPPETFDQSLAECEYYFEKSYNTADLIGTMTNNGAVLKEQLADVNGAGPPVNTIVRSFDLTFKRGKRSVAPTVTFYSPGGTINNVRMTVFNTGASCAFGDLTFATYFAQLGISEKNVTYNPNSVTTTTVACVQTSAYGEAFITFHYTCDARLGI